MKAKKLFSTSNKEVSFAWIDPHFTKWFGDMAVGKGNALKGEKLPRAMTSQEIMNELKPGTVSLGDIYETLKTLDKSTWCLFYAEDSEGASRLVRVRWGVGSGGWRVDCNPFTNSYRWGGGHLLFSRDSRDAKTLSPSDPLSLRSSDPLESRITSLEQQMAKLVKVINID